MKKVFSLLLAVLMLISVLPVAYATETQDYTQGTAVVYTAPNSEGWTITVPAKLAPGSSGPVTLEGYWPGNKQITVTAQKNVVLTNSINAANQKSLDISFVGISELGSNTERQEFTEYVSVEPIANALFGTWNGYFYYNVGSQELDTIEQLQAKHEFTYYSTMNAAVNDVNNGTIGASADSDKEDAVAGVYTDENGVKNVVLLKDQAQSGRITVSADMTINLGGKTLTIENDYFGICGQRGGSNTVTIDGRLDGSSVVLNSSEGGGCTLSVSTNNFIINGGSYYVYESFSTSDYSANAVNVNTGGTATITNCVLKAYTHYLYGDETDYAARSQGVYNLGTVTLNDCYVMGTHSGVSNNGTLYVNGGTYEGYGHGGFYFSGDGSGNTAYVRNATIRQCKMPDGYTATSNCNGAGFYIGGSAGRDNISVYMDNCDIYGSSSQIVLRGSAGEQNNSLYISNSNVYDLDGDTISIRIDNDTHRLYIGTGNNFSVANAVTWGTITDWDGIVVNTDETYIYNG